MGIGKERTGEGGKVGGHGKMRAKNRRKWQGKTETSIKAYGENVL